MRVLIVDDGDRFRATVRQLFTVFGHSVVEAKTVTSAHAPLGKNMFDLVVSQLHDTDRNAAMIMAIRAQSPIPLLFIGRRGAPEIPGQFAGLAESVTAPFSLEGLSDRIGALMARHRDFARLHAALR
jgi:DNA-binding response OmpR family regulator